MNSEIIPETQPDFDHTRIIERPDGFYWLDKDTNAEYGPFETLIAAVEDMEYKADSDYEPAETLQEAEEEIGISDWIDPDTGLPAEESHIHLRDE